MTATANDLTAHAKDLHFGSLVIDGSMVVKPGPEHVARAKAGGITAVNHTVASGHDDWQAALVKMNRALAWIATNPTELRLVTRGQDLFDCKREGVEGIIFGPQDAVFLGDEVERVRTSYDMGLRILQLTYQGTNNLGDGCGVEDAGPLTGFGKDVVQAMNDLGIVVDLSHVSQATGWSALEVSKDPVVFTHAHSMSMTRVPRSKDDDFIKAVVEGGGAIGVTVCSALSFLTPKTQPCLDDFVKHVEYLLELVGPEAVAIGLDMSEMSDPARHEKWHRDNPGLDPDGYFFPYHEAHMVGMETPADAWKVTDALVKAGIDDRTIRLILGENWARIFSGIWDKK